MVLTLIAQWRQRRQLSPLNHFFKNLINKHWKLFWSYISILFFIKHSPTGFCSHSCSGLKYSLLWWLLNGKFRIFSSLLHVLVGNLLEEGAFLPSCSFSHSLYQYGFMDSHFILWVIIIILMFRLSKISQREPLWAGFRHAPITLGASLTQQDVISSSHPSLLPAEWPSLISSFKILLQLHLTASRGEAREAWGHVENSWLQLHLLAQSRLS